MVSRVKKLLNPSNRIESKYGMVMTKSVLMIAYHFPPIRHSSGIQRTLKFATYLRDYGWQPIILSVNPIAYPETGNDQLKDIPKDVPVYRAFALDTVRHLSFKGKYPFFLGNPDRWKTWVPFAIRLGKKIVKKHNPAALWSTYPIPSAHVIGAALKRHSNLPWVADFRDQMIEPGFPPNPIRYAKYEKIEKRTIQESDAAVFTTPGTVRVYTERYPTYSSEKWHLIENGYDEENFARASKRPPSKRNDNEIVLVHAGILYPRERDPTHFFDALSELKQENYFVDKSVQVILRATGHDEYYAPILEEKGISDIVMLAPGIAYEDALTEMMSADGLLLFQAQGCNNQIPAKIYEYMRAQRPLLALTDPIGDTATVTNTANAGIVAPLDRVNDIKSAMQEFIRQIQENSYSVAAMSDVAKYSRQHGAKKLASILDLLTA